MSEFRYTNPLTSGKAISMRDHYILKVQDRWHMTGTAHPVWSGQHPGVFLFESTDLLH